MQTGSKRWQNLKRWLSVNLWRANIRRFLNLLLLFLGQFPACEELSKWAKVVLETTAPSAAMEYLDTKALLATMSKDDIVRVMDRKKEELKRMRKMMENK